MTEEGPAERSRREREEDDLYRRAQQRGFREAYEAKQRRLAQPPPPPLPPAPLFRRAAEAAIKVLVVVFCVVAFLVAVRACSAPSDNPDVDRPAPPIAEAGP